MQFHEFIGQVQHRARLSDEGEAVKATRATLETLGERLFGGEADDLAAQLPEEIALYLHPQEKREEKFNLDDFFNRVSEREGTGLQTAVFHARAVVSVLCDAVDKGEIDDVRNQLSKDWDPLFESGAEGPMRTS